MASEENSKSRFTRIRPKGEINIANCLLGFVDVLISFGLEDKLLTIFV